MNVHLYLIKPVFINLILVFTCLRPIRSIVTERNLGMIITSGYSLTDDAETFNYKGKRYLIMRSEYFDDSGQINHVAMMKSEGYLTFNKTEIVKMKNFLAGNNFSQDISLEIINDHQICLNSKTIKVDTIDREHHLIYYKVKSKVLNTYQLHYK